MIFIIICGYIYFGIGFFSYLFPQYYFSELFLSFLPYHIVISFIGLIFGLILFRYVIRKHRFFSTYFKKYILGLLILLFGILFLIFSRKFTNFYNFPVNQIENNMTGGIKILYANIYKNNINYIEIEKLIEKENPDLIFFVEFADDHYQNLKNILDKKYPYSNSTIRSQKYVGNMVFSKKEIENRADDFPQGAWKYGYFSVNYENKPIFFYLVHMSSPISKKYFDMRNNQIDYFFKDFLVHQEVHRIKNDKVVAIGDFNTSPWSIFYWNFAKGFEGEYINVTRYLPIVFTWKSVALPILWSHIDHVFVNKFVKISDFSVVSISGSDHFGFSFNIK